MCHSRESGNPCFYATLAKMQLYEYTIGTIGGSSNGRTTAFEAVYLGPNPSPPGLQTKMQNRALRALFCVLNPPD